MDLDRTKDGRIVAHHDNSMERLFHKDAAIKDFTLEELKAMPLYNYTGGDNVDRLESFDEILDALKDKTILVLDRCWGCWDEVYRLLNSRGMLKQAIFKFYLEDDTAYQWAAKHPEDPIFQAGSFQWLKEHEIKVWCNSLSLARNMIFGAGYDDLKSIREGGDKGWAF